MSLKVQVFSDRVNPPNAPTVGPNSGNATIGANNVHGCASPENSWKTHVGVGPILEPMLQEAVEGKIRMSDASLSSTTGQISSSGASISNTRSSISNLAYSMPRGSANHSTVLVVGSSSVNQFRDAYLNVSGLVAPTIGISYRPPTQRSVFPCMGRDMPLDNGVLTTNTFASIRQQIDDNKHVMVNMLTQYMRQL